VETAVTDNRKQAGKGEGQRDGSTEDQKARQQQRTLREASALRANLAKRKAQKRARTTVEKADPGDRLDT